MIFPENFEQKIGFDQIRLLLVSTCLSTMGKEKVDSMDFSCHKDRIDFDLLLCEEFLSILTVSSTDFPTDCYFDLREALVHVRIQGTWLDESCLNDLRGSLETLKGIVRFVHAKDGEMLVYPCLHGLAEELPPLPDLTGKIDSILDKYGRIRDNASDELRAIRSELRTVSGRISSILNQLLKSARNDGLVESDASPTIRDGRLVIPVMPAFKRKMKGIVHDESASGKTVFIEPAEVVEANNRIRELERRERKEIIRILIAFTDGVRPYIDELLVQYDFLGTIDFVRSKALLAQKLSAVKPLLVDYPVFNWIGARHPLLFLSHHKLNKSVVPLSIALSGEKHILVISGPNAGGKSVCLKTVGLLQYMLQCGLLVPVDENSQFGVFEGIFIDIGDEQSIENDLSTYSSHLQNMKCFLRHCNARSLLLIDEFGSGTEPELGGALAEALLMRFTQSGAFGVITTHYRNLKHFAESHSGVLNGAMLYDRHQMKALFTLSVGNPGSSFAIEIARSIGLPEDVIADAASIVGNDFIEMDKYLQDIVRDKRYWENKRQSARIKEKRLDELIASYEADMDVAKKQRKEILKDARMEAESILREANARIEKAVRVIRESQADKLEVKRVREDLNLFKLSLTTANADCPVQKVKKGARVAPSGGGDVSGLKQPATCVPVLKPGDYVHIKGQTQQGQLIEINKKYAVVVFGMVKTTVKPDRLVFIKVPVQSKPTTSLAIVADDIRDKKLRFKQDIDVRGMRGDEALQAVMYFIDDAVLVGVPRVRILHGTGTGILRQLIRDYLETVGGVKSFSDEHVQFGGTGITIVDLE